MLEISRWIRNKLQKGERSKLSWPTFIKTFIKVSEWSLKVIWKYMFIDKFPTDSIWQTLRVVQKKLQIPYGLHEYVWQAPSNDWRSSWSMTFRYFRTFILFFHYWVRRVSKSWVSFEYSDLNLNRITLENKNLPSHQN